MIDSSVFIGLERRGLPLRHLSVIGPDVPAFVASVTAFELLIGVDRAKPEERKAARSRIVETILEEIQLVSFDLVSARVYANVWVDLAAKGTPIGTADLLIASTALAHGHDVMTDNLREFRHVQGLTVIAPQWPT